MVHHFYPGHHPGFQLNYQYVEIDPTFVASAVTTWQGRTIDSNPIDIPAGAAGDMLLLIAFKYGGTATPAVPSGWTDLGSSASTGPTRVRAAAAYTTNASATTINVTGFGTTSHNGVCFVLRFRNTDGVASAFANIDLAFGGASSFNPPNVNLSGTRKAIFVAWMGNGCADAASAAPSGFSSLTNGGGGAFVSGDARAAHARLLAQASSMDPGAFTTSSSSSPDFGITATFGIVGTFVPQ